MAQDKTIVEESQQQQQQHSTPQEPLKQAVTFNDLPIEVQEIAKFVRFKNAA